jgi:hypothetical protein
VPEILSLHPLPDGVAPGELRKDGGDAVSAAAEEGTPFGSGISRLARVGREQFDIHVRRLFFYLRVVVAFSDDDPVGAELMCASFFDCYREISHLPF